MNYHPPDKPFDPAEEDLGDLIAQLAPDVSWVADATLPTADDIRERARGYTPEQREAARRDAFRGESGITAMAFARHSVKLRLFDEADYWLTIAEQQHMAEEAAELRREMDELRRRIPEPVLDGDPAYPERIVAEAAARADAIVEQAKKERDKLIDDGLVKLQEIVDGAKYSAARAGLLTSLAELAEPERISNRGRPTLLWLLSTLLSSLGIQVSQPINHKPRLTAVRVPRGTPLASLLSPPVVDTMRIHAKSEVMFRVLWVPDSAPAGRPLLPDTQWGHTARFRDSSATSVTAHRWVVVLPSHAWRPGSDESDDDLLLALAEYLVPNHGLNLDQVRKLSWDAIRELLNGDSEDTVHALSATMRHACAVDATVAITSTTWQHQPSAPQEGSHAEIVRGYFNHLRPRHDRPADGTAAIAAGQGETHSPSGSTELARVWQPSPLTGPGGGLPPGSQTLEKMTVPEALQELVSRNLDLLVFLDVASGHPTVVYRRAADEHGVMKLGEMQPAHLEAMGHEAVQMLSDPSLQHAAHPHLAGSELPSDQSSDRSTGFDEFLIIDSAPLAS